MIGIPMADALPSMEELDRLCKKNTGMDLLEWDETFRNRRSRAAAIKALRSDRPLSHSKMMEWIWKYGFQPHDFRTVQVSTSAVRNFEPNFHPPVNRHTGKQAETVIRWFLNPDVIPT